MVRGKQCFIQEIRNLKGDMTKCVCACVCITTSVRPLTEKCLQIQCLKAKKIPLTVLCCLASAEDTVLLGMSGEELVCGMVVRLDAAK